MAGKCLLPGRGRGVWPGETDGRGAVLPWLSGKARRFTGVTWGSLACPGALPSELQGSQAGSLWVHSQAGVQTWEAAGAPAPPSASSTQEVSASVGSDLVPGQQLWGLGRAAAAWWKPLRTHVELGGLRAVCRLRASWKEPEALPVTRGCGDHQDNQSLFSVLRAV